MVIYVNLIENENDKALFVKMYHELNKKVYLKAYEVLQNREDAEDSAQNTWFDVAKKIELFRDMEYYPLYILEIAHGKAVDILRKKNRALLWQEKNIETFCDEIHEDSVFLHLFTQENAELVYDCVSQLEEEERHILMLYYYYEKSTSYIAKLYNLKPATVKTKLARGRGKLRTLLEAKKNALL